MPSPRRARAAAAAAALGLLTAPGLASADTFPWSGWKVCDVNLGSDKQVRMQWHTTGSGSSTAVKPYRIEWKTNAPGIPLKPVKKYRVVFHPSPTTSTEMLPAAYAAVSWYLNEAAFGWRFVTSGPYAVVDLYETNGNRICGTTVRY